jgi:hypothetical protein
MVILSHPQHNFAAAKYSPDGRWLAFYFAVTEPQRTLFIAPTWHGKAAPEGEWISVASDRGHARQWWSSDGNRLYFLANRSGRVGLWTQRLDPASKRPLEEPVLVYVPQDERLALQDSTLFGPAEGRDRVIFPILERGGNIWIAEFPPGR